LRFFLFCFISQRMAHDGVNCSWSRCKTVACPWSTWAWPSRWVHHCNPQTLDASLMFGPGHADEHNYAALRCCDDDICPTHIGHRFFWYCTFCSARHSSRFSVLFV
jgi:hypothetical protein